MRKNDTLTKIGRKFDRELMDIKTSRRGEIDKDLPKEISKARITDGIIKCAEWNIIKEKLIKEPRKEDLEPY